jgi:DNA-binding transcriptional MocR family regulator
MTDLVQDYRIEARSAGELVRAVERAVAGGELAPGARLPSVRRLADEVGLSPATVAAGLAELRRRGVVVTEPRRGTRIGDAPPIGSSLRPLPVPPGARDLASGNPDPALLPDLKRALARVELPERLYGEPAALAPLLDLARGQLMDDGIHCGEVCVVSGALDGIERVLSAWLRPGDRVAVENPGYAALFDLLRAQGMALEPASIDDFGMTPDGLRAALEKGARAVVLTPRGHNPTGAAFDARRARELNAVLREHPEVLLVEDDHLGPVAGAPMHTASAGLERWAATRSVAKSLGPDLRLAVLTGDAQTIARVEGRQQCGPGWVSHVLQSIVIGLWRDAEVGELIAHAERVYGERREHLLGSLERRGIPACGRAGLNVWIEVPDEVSTIGSLLQCGWVLAGGSRYRLPGSTPGIRVTAATLLPEESERLADDLARALAPAGSVRGG